MKRIVAMVVAVTALGGSAVSAQGDSDAEALAEAAFVQWGTDNGVALTRIACHVADVVTCYGLDAAGVPTTATLNPDGTFALIGAASPVTSAPPTSPAAVTGSRDAPIPIGAPADVGDGWTLTINTVNLDAWAEISAANSFNEPPPEGSVYVMINMTAAYNGNEEKAVDFFSLSGVTSGNVELNTYDTFVLPPDFYDGSAEVFAGGSKSGNVVMTVPTAEVESLVLYTSAGFDTDDVYFATR